MKFEQDPDQELTYSRLYCKYGDHRLNCKVDRKTDVNTKDKSDRARLIHSSV